MLVELEKLSHADAYKLLISALVPRPIAFISSLGADGTLNLAPFSFFMGAGSNPPMIAVSIEAREGRPKDTVRNIRHSGDFVVNLVTEEIAAAMNQASGDWPYEVDEFALTGLTPAPSARVRPPRVSESPVNFECRVVDLREIGRSPNTLIVAEVVCMHVRDDLVLAGKSRVDTAALHAVGRLGGPQYCRVRDIFEMVRPRVERPSGEPSG